MQALRLIGCIANCLVRADPIEVHPPDRVQRAGHGDGLWWGKARPPNGSLMALLGKAGPWWHGP